MWSLRWNTPSLKRGKQRNEPTPLLAVDGEVAVEGEKNRARILFDHDDEASISQGHGNISVRRHKFERAIQAMRASEA